MAQLRKAVLTGRLRLLSHRQGYKRCSVGNPDHVASGRNHR